MYILLWHCPKKELSVPTKPMKANQSLSFMFCRADRNKAGTCHDFGPLPSFAASHKIGKSFPSHPLDYVRILFDAQICLSPLLQHTVKVDPKHKVEVPFWDKLDFSPRFGTVLFPHLGNVGGWKLRCTVLLGPGGGRQRRDTKETIVLINKCSMRLISHGIIKTLQHLQSEQPGWLPLLKLNFPYVQELRKRNPVWSFLLLFMNSYSVDFNLAKCLSLCKVSLKQTGLFTCLKCSPLLDQGGSSLLVSLPELHTSCSNIY